LRDHAISDTPAAWRTSKKPIPQGPYQTRQMLSSELQTRRATLTEAERSSPFGEFFAHRLGRPAGPPHNEIRAALTSAPGIELLEGVINSSILTGFSSEPDCTEGWRRLVSLENYLSASIGWIDRPTLLQPIGRGSKAATVSYGYAAESWRLARFAALEEFDERDLIDAQNVGFFVTALEEFGRAARRLVPDLVFALLAENPTMDSDGEAFISEAHGNVGADALSESSVDIAIGVLGGQTLVTVDGAPVHVNYSPSHLVVNPAKAGLARRLRRNLFLDRDDDDALTVHSESRLSNAGVVDPRDPATVRTFTGSEWLLTVDSSQAAPIMLGVMGGTLTPLIRTGPLDSGQWGRWVDLTLSVGVAPGNWKAIYLGGVGS
jgi:hypothetical protein